MTRQLRTRLGGLGAVVGVALTVAACGSSSSNSASSSAPAATPAASTSAGGLTISTTKGSAGTYLTGASGRALYLWVADSGGKSACSGACAKVWPPVIASGKPSASSGVNAADIGTVARSDGTKQVTYKGHPLYYFVADPASGTITGQGSDSFGAKWWLVTPAGAAITSSSGATSSGGGSAYGASSSSGASSSGGASASGSSWS